MNQSICSFVPCERPYYAKGLCKPHYYQHIRGNPLTMPWPSLLTKIQTIVARPDGDDGCWIWTKRISTSGYGVVAWEGTEQYVHRAVLIESGTDIPPGLEVDHLCRNTVCCNPDHLEVVTHLENVRRAAAVKTHCKNGHEYTEENTHWYGPDKTWRDCRACWRKPWRKTK